MAKYGISTDVLDTYVADFHGTTVQIFEKQSPDAETNKPVCYDCHGIHDIAASDDPEKGLKVKENLLVTCQKCHPDAGPNWTSAWTGHNKIDPQRTPYLYAVDQFYTQFAQAVLWLCIIYVVLQIIHAIVARVRRSLK